jgi:hypothetical protein
MATTEQLTFLDHLEALRRAEVFDDLGLIPENLGDRTIDEFESMARAFGAANKGIRFAFGDLLNECERQHGELYAQVMDVTGLGYSTVKNYAWVALSVKRSRRRDDLTWTHHEIVAKLAARDQRRWLTRAASVPLTTDELRAEITQAGEEAADSAVEPVRGRVTLKDAARSVWISSSKHGETYHVPVDMMLALGRALGEPV